MALSCSHSGGSPRRTFFQRVASRKALGFVVGVAGLATLGASGQHDALVAAAPAASAEAAAQHSELAERSAELLRYRVVLDRIAAGERAGLPAAEQAAFDVAIAADAAVATAEAVLPQVARLALVEARQLAAAETLADRTETRAARAEQAIRRTGINPRLALAKLDDRSAQGGPLLALAGTGRPLDPRFARLGASLARMGDLQRVLDGIPSYLPTGLEYISSPFGVRSDPITGEPALHAGLDFRGPIGTPVHAAASGTVTYAGDRGGYGNCLEITHANGMVTRYAHLSAFKAHVGEKVAAGTVVGAIGNTGRSTGPHLHFEVRVNGQAVNPRPFLNVERATTG